MKPNRIVNWGDIMEVQINSEVLCPICLGPPRAGRMNRCGHTYCISCVYRYLCYDDGDDGKEKKCPICKEERIEKGSLKPCTFSPPSLPTVGQHCSFQLMGCITNTLELFIGKYPPPPPLEEISHRGFVSGISIQDLSGNSSLIPFHDTPTSPFSRLTLSTPDSVLDRLRVDIQSLRRVIEEVKFDGDPDEDVWMEACDEAMCVLRDEERTWPGGKKMREVKKIVRKMKKRFGIIDEEEQRMIDYAKSKGRRKVRDAWGDDEEEEEEKEEMKRNERRNEALLSKIGGEEDLQIEVEEDAQRCEIQSPPSYSFYQSSDGSSCYLHPLILECLKDNQQLSVEDSINLPISFEGEVLEITEERVCNELKRSHSFLSHLPNYSTIYFVEIGGVEEIVCEETWRKFQTKFQGRERWRERKRREEVVSTNKEEEDRKINDERIRSLVERRQRERMEAMNDLKYGPSLIDSPIDQQDGKTDEENSESTSQFSFSQVTQSGGYFPELGSEG